MSEHCDDDGKGGCTKHPPTMSFTVHKNDEAALRSWLDWYHRKEQP